MTVMIDVYRKSVHSSTAAYSDPATWKCAGEMAELLAMQGDDAAKVAAVVALLKANHPGASATSSAPGYSICYDPDTGRWFLTCEAGTVVSIPEPPADPIIVTLRAVQQTLEFPSP